jgi:flagellin-like hook-associated protein FlgL
VYGAPADATYAFDVLIRLRDSLESNRPGVLQALALAADLTGGGAANPAAFQGIDGATDLRIDGPLGGAFVRLTAGGDDTVSTAGNATSAIALAAAINAATAATGVAAVATAATFVVPGSAELFDDITLGPGDLVINGQSVQVTLAAGAGNNALNRDTFIAAVNALAATTGVVAAAGPGSGITFTAADGRNIAIRTAAGSGDGSVADEILGFAGPLAADTVVARGGVQLSAAGVFTTTEANAADEIAGEGRASGVGVALEDLGGALERMLGPQTLVGARLNWIGLVEERLGGESVSLAGARSRLEDLDVPAAVQEYEQMKLFYEAALASSAGLIRTSLLDFLR